MSWLKDNVDQEGIIDYLFTITANTVTSPNGKEFVYRRNVKDDLTIDFDRLEEQIVEMPQIISFYNLLLVEQKMKVEIEERRIKKLRGKIVERFITKASENQVEYRSTELKELINADDDLIAKEAVYIQAQYKYERIKVVVECLMRKFDALRSLAGFKRGEMRNA